MMFMFHWGTRWGSQIARDGLFSCFSAIGRGVDLIVVLLLRGAFGMKAVRLFA